MIKLINGKQGQQIAVLINDTHISKWVEETGELCHDKTVTDFIVPWLKTGDVVVDVGANIGDHTIAYARAVGLTGKVYAFEPQGPAFACLVFNTTNLPQVRPYCLGLSDREDLVFMHSEHGNVGASYITDRRDICLYPAFAMPLDLFMFERLNLIKLDIEGWEFTALIGAQYTIKRHKPIILCEINRGALARNHVSPARLIKFIEDMGYAHHFLDPLHTLEMEQFDLLFLPK